jgi:hypothetical protein
VRLLTRDILIGTLSGLIAFGVMSFRRERQQFPGGLYQVSLDLPKYREMASMLRPPASSAEAHRKLHAPLNAPDIRGAAFDKVLAYLADVSGVEIEVEWGVLAKARIARNEPVDVRLTAVSALDALRQALSSVARQSSHKLAFQIENGIVRISTEEALSKDIVTRVYDVRDIIHSIVNSDKSLMTPRRIPAQTSPGPVKNVEGLFADLPFTDFCTSPQDAAHLLIDSSMNTIDPTSWRHNGGSLGQIQYFAGRLVVTQTRPNHDALAAMIYWMREEIVHEPKPQ